MSSEEERQPEQFESVYVSHKSQHDWAEGHDADMLMDALIAEVCAADPCAGQMLVNKGTQQYSVDYLANNLPAVQYVGQFYLELIIHGGLVAKDDFNQKKLNDWLQQKGPLGQSNGNIIREALLSSIIYGYSGLRKVFDNLIYVAPNHFKIWKIPYTVETTSLGKNGKLRISDRPVPGVKAPVLYEIKDKPIGYDESTKKPGVFVIDNQQYTLQEVVRQNSFVEGVDGSFFLDDGADGALTTDYFVTANNFCHLRHSDEGTYGRSPLVTDRLRTTLIIDYLRNVIDEVNNDGNDYLMYLRQRGTVGSSFVSSISNAQAETITKRASDIKQSKSMREKQLEAARSLAKKLKRTQKTRIGIISEDWVDRIEKLEGTVRLNEYLSILNDAKGVVADIYGIPAMLAGSSGGGWSTGMSALIPFTLERTIKPFQQRYAEQLGDIVRECSGVKGEIKFKEINWEDEKTQAEIDKLRAETLKALAEANAAKVTGLKTTKEASLLNKRTGNNQAKNNKNEAK